MTEADSSGRRRRLSIVICTHNRSADVLRCLEALHPQIGGSELVLVDSASSAEERAAVASGLDRFPGIRYIQPEELGLSVARNAGIEASTGEWVAFLDDDTVPHPDWHERLLAVLDRTPDDCGAIGGRILPLFPNGASPTLSRRWKMYVSINDAVGSRDCTEKFELICANCCFRRIALDAAGGFPVELGRYGNALLSGEDVLLMERVRELGWRIRFDDEFCVGHKVSSERLTREWVQRRAYWEGITSLRRARLMRTPERTSLPLKAAVATPIVWMLSRLGRPEQEWDLRFWYDWGVVVEALRLRAAESKGVACPAPAGAHGAKAG